MNLPIPEYGKTDKDTIDNLMDTLVKFRKELDYALKHISVVDINDLIFPDGYSDAEAVAAWAASGYATYINATGVYTGTLAANQIIVGGDNGYIAFTSISGVPAFVTGAEAVAAWDASAYSTYINASGVYTGTVAANQIIVGTLEGYLSLSQIADAGVLAALDSLTASYVTDLGDLATLNSITLAKVTDSGALAALNNVTSTYIADGAIITAKIAAGAVLAGNIAADAVTATHINVTNLSAISANMGTITAGTITGGSLMTAASGQRVAIGTYGVEEIGLYYSDSDYAFLYKSSSALIITSVDDIILNAGGGDIYLYGNPQPDADNGRSCGESAARWSYVYSYSGSFLSNVSVGGQLYCTDAYSRVITTRALYVNSGGEFGTASSSRRVKNNIKHHDFNLDALMQLDVVEFNFKPEVTSDQTIQHGFIAEDAHDLGLTELVQYDEQGIPDYFAYEKLPVALLQVCQNLNERLEKLEAKNG